MRTAFIFHHWIRFVARKTISCAVLTSYLLPLLAQAREPYFVYQFQQGDQVGKILDALHICPLWGKSGKVEEFFQWNPQLDPLKARQVATGEWVKIPLQANQIPNDPRIEVRGNQIVFTGQERPSFCPKPNLSNVRVPAAETTKPKEPIKNPEVTLSKIAPPAHKDINTESPQQRTFKLPDVNIDWKLGFALHPSYSGLSQTLGSTGDQFLISNYSLQDFVTQGKAVIDDDFEFLFELQHHNLSLGNMTAEPYQLVGSSTRYLSPRVQLSYCQENETRNFRFCPNIGYGVDSVPILTFSSNTDLTLMRAEDAFANLGFSFIHTKKGLNLNRLHFDFLYQHGLGRGQNILVDWQANKQFLLSFGFSTPIRENVRARIDTGANYHNYQLTQGTDLWSGSQLRLYLGLGLEWSWDQE